MNSAIDERDVTPKPAPQPVEPRRVVKPLSDEELGDEASYEYRPVHPLLRPLGSVFLALLRVLT